MGFYEKLHAVTFRGVTFYVTSESVTRGKKTAIHEYPNSDFRYVEELGKQPPTFSLTALVHGEDFLNKRFRLEQALEESGIGLLNHPIYGKLWVAVLDFTVDTSQTNIGVVNFSINFSQSKRNITPSPTTRTPTAVSSKAVDVRDKIHAAVENKFKEISSAFNYDQISERLGEVLDNVRDNVNLITELSSKGAAEFNRVYNSITNSTAAVLSSAYYLSQNMSLFYDTALDSAVFVSQLAPAWDRIMDIDIPLISSTTTPSQKEKEQDKSILSEQMRLIALANAYDSKVNYEYTTEEQLLEARNTLDYYYRLFLNDSYEEIESSDIETIAGDPDVRAEFAELRVIARQVFDEKRKTLFRVINITPGITSMSITSFRYYGNLDYIEDIIDLNPEVNVANFNTTIKALSQ